MRKFVGHEHGIVSESRRNVHRFRGNGDDDAKGDIHDADAGTGERLDDISVTGRFIAIRDFIGL